ncbi:MAG: hypothetical protein ACREHD_03060 [Pirellulales bacterium]
MENWLNPLLDDLSDSDNWSYQRGGVAAAEPMALAALALATHGRAEAAPRACQRLAALQADDGGVPAAAQSSPCWPTGWAVLAWSKTDSVTGGGKFRENTARAIDCILSLHGRTMESLPDMGHNPRLDGWPWVAGTHPWSEPTAINLLALKATGRAGHPRAREAAAMLLDRLLPEGGSNYGNTTVLGQVLRPHVEPTGLVAAALAGEADASGRLERSLVWLEQVVGKAHGAASLAYAILGLAAHERRPKNADAWLAAAAQQTSSWQKSPLRKALIALAGAQPCPLHTASNQQSCGVSQ